MKKDIRWYIEDHEPISGNINKRTLQFFGLQTIIVIFYALYDDAIMQTKKAVLGCTYLYMYIYRKKIMASDLNVRVGGRKYSWVVGRCGGEVVNQSGLLSIKLCELNYL